MVKEGPLGYSTLPPSLPRVPAAESSPRFTEALYAYLVN